MDTTGETMKNIEEKIQKVRRELQAVEAAKKREAGLREELEKLEQQQKQQDIAAQFSTYYHDESRKVIEKIDKRSIGSSAQSPDSFEVLFLGGCCGQWAARTSYQGQLPGFGGFLITANGKSILVNPGVSTFDEFLKLGIHPQSLDAVIVTHSDWHITRDLSLILRAAGQGSIRNRKFLKQQWQQKGHWKQLRLVAHPSVLYGTPQSLETVVGYTTNSTYFPEEDKATKIADLQKRLEHIPYLSPGSVSSFDLFFRLDGYFQELEIDQEYRNFLSTFIVTDRRLQQLQGKLKTDCLKLLKALKNQEFFRQEDLMNAIEKQLSRKLSKTEEIRIVKAAMAASQIDLFTHRSYHRISFTDTCIPALDFIITRHHPRPDVRCVYLSHTAYDARVAPEYTGSYELSKPIDLLICDLHELHVKEGHKNLGWEGLLTLTKDFQDQGLLVDSSLVVLRDWGLEAVLEVVDGVLVAAPEKLSVFQEYYKQATGVKQVLIPGITRVQASDEKPVAFTVTHHREPFHLTGDRQTFGGIFYSSEAMQAVVRKAWAATQNPKEHILITGETGTGKDELAKAIHQEAGREGEILIVNSRMNLFYQQLVGWKKGAFTDAGQDQRGFLETASKGTLVIQEIGDMTEKDQTSLLTLLEERAYSRLGEPEVIREIQAQLIFTTNKPLTSVREDFFHRMQRHIHIPPLRERPEDIPILLDAWRGDTRYEQMSHMPGFTEEQIELLKAYPWRGNIRQLQNTIRTLTEMMMEFVEQTGRMSPEQLNRKLQESLHEILQQAQDHGQNDTDAPSPRQLAKEDGFDDLTPEEDHILDLLKVHGTMSLKEIQGQNGLTKGTLRNRLNHLIELKLIRKLYRGPKTQYQIITLA